MDIEALKNLIRAIPDYPTVGVTFRDITPLLSHPNAFSSCIDLLAERFTDQSIDLVIGVEARGFILGAPMAVALGAGFIPVRKAGKLPWAVVREEYDLEYGSDKLEIHRDAIQPAQRVLIVDDVLATGGTAAARTRPRTRRSPCAWRTSPARRSSSSRSPAPAPCRGACR